MKINYEVNSIVDFDAWSGGLQRQKEIIEAKLVNEYDDYLEDILSEEGVEQTELNDILWFDTDDWLEEQYKARLMQWYNNDADSEIKDEIDRIGLDKLEEYLVKLYEQYPMFITDDVIKNIEIFIENNSNNNDNE